MGPVNWACAYGAVKSHILLLNGPKRGQRDDTAFNVVFGAKLPLDLQG